MSGALVPPPDERFALVRQDAAYQEALAWAPPPEPMGIMATEVVGVILGAMIAAAWIRLNVTGVLAAGLGLALTAAVIGAGTWLRRRWFVPIERQLAVAVGRRTIARRGRHRPIYEERITLALEDGSQRELSGDETIVSAVGPGEVGLAFVRHRRLLGFRRLLA